MQYTDRIDVTGSGDGVKSPSEERESAREQDFWVRPTANKAPANKTPSFSSA